jgi:hypothetical protein
MDTPPSFISRLPRALFALRALLAACSVFVFATLAQAQATPKETFEAFKKAFAARDGAAATALMKASDADKEGLTKALPTLPEEGLKEIISAVLADLKVDGNAAIGIVQITSKEGEKKYDDQLFVKEGGKWFITDNVPSEDTKKALREWYDGRVKELQAADKK